MAKSRQFSSVLQERVGHQGMVPVCLSAKKVRAILIKQEITHIVIEYFLHLPHGCPIFLSCFLNVLCWLE